MEALIERRWCRPTADSRGSLREGGGVILIESDKGKLGGKKKKKKNPGAGFFGRNSRPVRVGMGNLGLLT